MYVNAIMIENLVLKIKPVKRPVIKLTIIAFLPAIIFSLELAFLLIKA